MKKHRENTEAGGEPYRGVRCRTGFRGGVNAHSISCRDGFWLAWHSRWVLTVFGHLQGVFALSDWGRWSASHWQLWMAALWSHSLGLFHTFSNAGFFSVDVPFAVCLSLIAVASHFSPGSDPDVSAKRRLYSLMAGAALLASFAAVLTYLNEHGQPLSLATFFTVTWCVVFLMLSHWPYRLALLSASATMILLTLMLIAGNDTTPPTHMDLVIENVLMIAAGAVVIFVARPSVFTRHIWTLLFLVAVLVAASELSKLGVSLEPPKA